MCADGAAALHRQRGRCGARVQGKGGALVRPFLSAAVPFRDEVLATAARASEIADGDAGCDAGGHMLAFFRDQRVRVSHLGPLPRRPIPTSADSVLPIPS